MTKPVVIGISGVSGAVYGIELVRMVQALNIATHLTIMELGAGMINASCTGFPQRSAVH